MDTTISRNSDVEHLTSAYDNLKILLDPEKYTNLNEKELMFTYYNYGLKFCFEELKILNADHKVNLLQHKKRKDKGKAISKTKLRIDKESTWKLDDASSSSSDCSIELKRGNSKNRFNYQEQKCAKAPSGCDSSNVKRNEDVIIVDNTDDKSVKDSIIDNKTIDKNCLFCFPFSYQIEDIMHTISYNDNEDDTLTLGMREARGQVCKFIQNNVVWEDAKTNS